VKKYYCSECERYHYRGKIYKDHLEYKVEKKGRKTQSLLRKRNSIPSENILDFDADKLRPIARRQIKRFLKKMKKTNKIRFYTREINRVIIYEQKNYMKKS
jgi:hypothetical protein